MAQVLVELEDGIPTILAPVGTEVKVIDYNSYEVSDDNTEEYPAESMSFGVELTEKLRIQHIHAYKCQIVEQVVMTSWCIDDVLSVASFEEVDLNREEAYEILLKLKEEFDAGIGINWTVIGSKIHEYIVERDKNS